MDHDMRSFRLRNGKALRTILDRIRELKVDMTVMHVCGTHQDTLVRFGLEEEFGKVGVRVIQGPGCPVCVTTPREILGAQALTRAGVTVACFGDMVRVPASGSTLADLRGAGADVRIVYSPEDAVRYARKDPEREVVFLGIGFETTAPSTAVLLGSELPGNLSVLSMHRTVPPALEALTAMGELHLDGIIQPGHVSAIIGTSAYHELLERKGICQVVAGFEPLDMARGVLELARQFHDGTPAVTNIYARVVRDEGNPLALELMDRAFEPRDVKWRGFPLIPGSGLGIRDREHDAERIHADILAETVGSSDTTLDREPEGCRCGEVLRGIIDPRECPLFAGTCTPAAPVGPCMVSHEGSCNILFRYRS